VGDQPDPVLLAISLSLSLSLSLCVCVCVCHGVCVCVCTQPCLFIERTRQTNAKANQALLYNHIDIFDLLLWLCFNTCSFIGPTVINIHVDESGHLVRTRGTGRL